MLPKGDPVAPLDTKQVKFETIGALPEPPAFDKKVEPINDETRQALRKKLKNNKKSLNKKDKEFEKALNSNRPSFNMPALITEFDRVSKVSSRRLVKLVLRSMAVTNAVSYANEELVVALDDPEVGFNIQEVSSFSVKMARLHVLMQMAKIYRLPADITAAIVNLQIAKDFGQLPAQARPVTPVTRPPPILEEKRNVKEKIDTKFKRKKVKIKAKVQQET